MSYNFPNSPTVGQLYPQPPVSGQPVFRWDGQKWITQTVAWTVPVSITFTISGKPLASMNVIVPVTIALTIPSGLTGAQAYANTAPTAAAAFTLNKISGGTTTALGTITMTAGSKTLFTLAGSGGSVVAGDVLQVTAPGTQDTTLADVGVTISVTRT